MKRLSAWNPLDHLRLLWWTLMEPQQLKAYREQYGEKAERPTAKWLVSTLLWLPLFLPYLAVGFEIISFSPYPLPDPIFDITLTSTHYLWGNCGLFIAWLLTGMFGDRDEIWVGLPVILVVGLVQIAIIGLAKGLAAVLPGAGALRLTVGLTVGLMVELAIGLAIGLAIVLGIRLTQWIAFGLIGPLATLLSAGVHVATAGMLGVILSLVLSLVLANAVKESLKTGRASWKTRGAFGLLVAVYAFLLWFSYLGGWRMF